MQWFLDSAQKVKMLIFSCSPGVGEHEKELGNNKDKETLQTKLIALDQKFIAVTNKVAYNKRLLADFGTKPKEGTLQHKQALQYMANIKLFEKQAETIQGSMRTLLQTQGQLEINETLLDTFAAFKASARLLSNTAIKQEDAQKVTEDLEEMMYEAQKVQDLVSGELVVNPSRGSNVSLEEQEGDLQLWFEEYNSETKEKKPEEAAVYTPPQYSSFPIPMISPVSPYSVPSSQPTPIPYERHSSSSSSTRIPLLNN
jgi:hypothetical protein